MPKFNGHNPDIPEGSVPLTNGELERLRKKYGEAVLEPDGGDTAADPAPAEAGGAAADGPVPGEGAEPGADAQDLLPALEPEPVREEEPESADDTPADYSGFFAGADRLLDELAPEAAAEAFARYIGGLSFDTQRGEMTAQAEWPALAAAPEPPAAPPPPAAGEPEKSGAESRRPAQAKKLSFFSARKARGGASPSFHSTADTPAHGAVEQPPAAEETGDTVPAQAAGNAGPAGLPQPPPAQTQPEVPVETVPDTEDLDFTKKYLDYAAPAVQAEPSAPADVSAQNGGEDIKPAAEVTAPAGEAPVEAAACVESSSSPAPAQAGPAEQSADADASAEAAETLTPPGDTAPAEETVPEADIRPGGEAAAPEQPAAPAEPEAADAAESVAETQSPVPGPPAETAPARQEAAPENSEENGGADIADSVSGEALDAEKPPMEITPPQPPVQPQSPPDAGTRIIYRAPEAAALDASGTDTETAEDRNHSKPGPAGISPYQKYMRVIYQAPGASLQEGEAAQAPPPADTALQPAAPGEEGAAAPEDTEQEGASEEAAAEAAETADSEEGGNETPAAGTQAGDAEQATGEPGTEQGTPGAGILAELSAEKKQSRFKRFLRAFFPQRGDSAAEKIRKSVLVLATLTIFVCGGILLNTYVLEPAMSNRQIAKAIELKKNSSLDKNWPDIQSKYAGVNFPQGMLPRYAGLYVANRDFAGWLTIEGLGIDMPLVQGETNGDYLRTDFYGKPSRYGCCFFDYRNNIKTLDRNTIVYGHNMGSSDLLMFGNREKYSRIDGFKAAPVIECNTLYALMKWKVYAVFVTNSLPSQDNGYLFNYIFPQMESDEDFAGYIAQLDRRKLYTTGVDLLKSDKILTLSTCSYEFDDARLVVVARLVRPGESEKVDTSLAGINPSPKYPQIWYNKNGRTNPYQNDEKWYP